MLARFKTVRCCAGALSLLGMFVAPDVQAITFDIVSVPGAANPNDPGDTGLLALVEEAASRWEDIIEDNFTMKLNVSYFVNNGAGVGPCGLNNQTACAPIVSDNAAENRTVEGNLFFFANRNWYIDPTPGTDDEFDFTQTLHLDLTSAQQAAGFSGAFVEPLLEVGFRGAANGTDPNAAGGFDMLSTAFHEIGHHLGITNQFQAALDETADDDYDLPPDLLGGRVMAVEASPGSEFHMVDSFPLMSAVGVGTGVRRLPAAADVLAAAAVSNWTQIDLSRQDFLQGTSWGTAGNWLGNQVPGAADSAFIRGGYNDLIGTGDIVLDQNDSVRNLFVGTSSNLRTGAFRLDVGGTTTIEFGGLFPFSQIFVETGGELETGNLDINGGELDMEGGLADIQNTLTITKDSSGGNLTGHGTVDVGSSLVNNGLINATDDGTLTFTTASSADVFDLDGLGNGEVRATSGNIVVNGNLVPAFAGEMNIGAGHFIQIDDHLRLTPAGELNLDGGTSAATAAELRGGNIEIEGDVFVEGRGEILGTLQFDPTALVRIDQADDHLTLGESSDTATFNGGTFTGDGRLVQRADMIVTTNSTVDIQVGIFDWDVGSGVGLTRTTLQAGASLIIDVDDLNDPHDGDVTLNSNSMLSVTTGVGDWDYDGTMTFNPTGFGTSIVNGSALNVTADGLLHFLGGTGVIEVNAGILGDLLVEGIANFNGTTGFGSGSTTTLNNGILRFNGPFTNYTGSTFTGNGLIQQNGSGSIVDDQTINIAGTFDWDGAGNDSQFFVNPGKSFNLTADNINLGNNIYSGQLNLLAGTVTVNVAADEWTMAGTLKMTGAIGQGGVLLGDEVHVTGDVVTDFGETHFFAAPSRFLAGSTTDVRAGTELHFNAPVVWVGGTHGGQGSASVNDSGVVDGGMLDFADLAIGGSATMTVNAGSVVASNFNKEAGGILNLEGGDFTIDRGDATLNSSLVYSGPSPGNVPTFRIDNGGNATVTFAWRVGESAGEFGATEIRGTGGGRRSTLRGSGGGGGADLVVGRAGVGTLDVLSGGLADFGDDLIIAEIAGSQGTVTVDGVDGPHRSQILVTRAGGNAALQVGRFGAGELFISNAAKVTVGGDGTIGAGIGSTGEVALGGSIDSVEAELQIGDDLAIGGSLGSAGGTGSVSINPGGLLTADRIIIWTDGSVDINGGHVVGSGDLTVDGGHLNVASGRSALRLTGGASIINRNGGTVSGGGTIILDGGSLVNNGLVSPGHSTRELTLERGDYVQESFGTLEIELTGPGTDDNEKLLIDGNASLAGQLDVQVIARFVPALGASYKILTAADGISSKFEGTSLTGLPATLAAEVIYDPNAVRLQIVPSLPGDFDLDGLGRGSDFMAWQRGDSQDPFSSGDLADWQRNFGSTLAVATAATVPEPGTAVLLLVGVAGLARGARLRRGSRQPAG